MAVERSNSAAAVGGPSVSAKEKPGITTDFITERFSSRFPPGGPNAASGRTFLVEEGGALGGRSEGEEGEDKVAVRAWVSARRTAWSDSHDCGYL
jgi:hypothetical protein